MGITLEEQETIILHNRADKTAEVFTYDPSTKTKLNKLCKEYPNHFRLTKKNGDGGNTYEFPKNLISIRAPRAKRELTEEQKKVIADRFAENRTKPRINS